MSSQTNLLHRNIPLMYLILSLDKMVFWSAIWVLFYLQYTNYAGIGLIESLMIITHVTAEVPTGAIADLLGKKKTLIIASLLSGLGNLIMGLAGQYSTILISVFIITIGDVLKSGTKEALIYDSLLTIKEERRYEKVLGNISTIVMLTLALASVIGGFMYNWSPGLPFIALALFQFIASGLCFLLQEPPIDSEKFSWSNYWQQTSHGIKELFKQKRLAWQNGLVIGLSMITMMNGHMLIDVQLVELGWDERILGIISAGMFILSALMSQLTPIISKKYGRSLANLLMAISIAMTMIFLPWLGLIMATGMVMLRNGLLEIFGNTASSIINHNVDSKYRATALSAYSMFANIPYVLTAFYIGKLMDIWSSDLVVVWLGVILLAITIVGLVGKNVIRYKKPDIVGVF